MKNILLLFITILPLFPFAQNPWNITLPEMEGTPVSWELILKDTSQLDERDPNGYFGRTLDYMAHKRHHRELPSGDLVTLSGFDHRTGWMLQRFDRNTGTLRWTQIHRDGATY